MSPISVGTRKLLKDAKVWALCAGATLGIALASPEPAFAVEESCPPGSQPTTGCDCTFVPDDFVECGCCEDSEGNPACLYCRMT